MVEQPAIAASRNSRRRTRTRSALLRAAQEILAEGGDAHVSVQALTDRADVAFGSLYNHFESKHDLFDAAIADAFEQYVAWRDAHTPGGTDAVTRFATNVRLTGRLASLRPDLAHILTHPLAVSAERPAGIAARLSHDLLAALHEIRADIPATSDDHHITVIAAAGAIAAVLRAAAHLDPPDQARLADHLTRDLLRMIGVTEALITDLLATACPPAR
ncbi:TetR/AcrR family transcriptional regulator [Streptomyces sp. NPDC052644]